LQSQAEETTKGRLSLRSMCVQATYNNTTLVQVHVSLNKQAKMTTEPDTPTSSVMTRCRRNSTSSASSFRRAKRNYVEHNYEDHFDDPIYVPGENEDEADLPKRRGPRGGVVVPFPERLYSMLNKVEEDGYEDVISWQPHGRCFVVHQPKRFVDEVIPK
jgi:hypothetical protein